MREAYQKKKEKQEEDAQERAEQIDEQRRAAPNPQDDCWKGEGHAATSSAFDDSNAWELPIPLSDACLGRGGRQRE